MPNDWKARHHSAFVAPRGHAEKSIHALVVAWDQYAGFHWDQHHTNIGDDSVLGPEWARIGSALRGLLNADLGRLDGGLLDRLICTTLEGQGFDPDTL